MLFLTTYSNKMYTKTAQSNWIYCLAENIPYDQRPEVTVKIIERTIYVFSLSSWVKPYAQEIAALFKDIGNSEIRSVEVTGPGQVDISIETRKSVETWKEWIQLKLVENNFKVVERHRQ